MPSRSKKYDRLYVAMATPMLENGRVDEAGMRKFLHYFMQPKFVDAGGAVIINPEAGEVFYLNRKEKRRNVEIAMEECSGKVPVFAGVIDLTTEDAVKVAVDARDAGADGIFLLPPMGSGDVTVAWDPERYPEVYIDFAKAEIEAVNLPAIVHPTCPITALWGVGMPIGPSLQMCREIPDIVGWKMTYAYNGSLKIARGLRSLDRHVGILGAAANFFHENLATGYFDGTATGAFNYAMEAMVDHIGAWREKDIDKANKIWYSGLADLQDYVYGDISRLHTRYKVATWLRGHISSPFLRNPQPQPRKEEIDKIWLLLRNAGLSVIDKKDVKKIADKLSR
ncbi:MAG: hypothetical protein A2144_00725 [Chloroflexi bacterium RBG_16_50_9]|nr:MAG: hypothetical protein A2144_00725 [Chloroflexi bacterium RBG_16_50_9]